MPVIYIPEYKILFDNSFITFIILLLVLYFTMAKNLNVASFNCTGFKFRNYDYLQDIFKRCDILLIQETWLYNYKHEDIGKVLTPCSVCHGRV